MAADSGTGSGDQPTPCGSKQRLLPRLGTTVSGSLFRKYVSLFLVVVTLALSASGLFELWFSFREHRTALVRVQQEQAAAAADKIAQFIKEIEGHLGWTTQLPWAAAAIEQRRFDALRLLRQVPAITELTQLDGNGLEQLKVSRLAMDVIGSKADFSRDARFQGAMAGKVYYGRVYFRRESEPYMTLAMAGARRSAGVTLAEVNLKFIWDIVSQIKVGQRGAAYVVDAQGRLIAHPDISLVLRNTDMNHLSQVASARLQRPAGNDTAALDLKGQRVLTAHSSIAPLRWLMFVELPEQEAYAPLWATIKRSFLLLLTGLSLAFFAGLALARRMVVPIQALTAGAIRIGSGNLDQRIIVDTGDELEVLANSFNDMAGRLQESYALLEDKVEARTLELARSVEELRALGEVSQAVNSTLDLDIVLSTIVARAVSLSGTDAGAIYVYDTGTQEFTLQATHNMPEVMVRAIRERHIILGQTTVGRAASERNPVQIADLQDEPDSSIRQVLLNSGFRALLAVPLIGAGRIVGGLVVRRKEPGTFGNQTVELMQTFAAQSVLALQNARLFREIEDKGRQLEVASRHKSQFLANMSHELRTPLNAILGYTELISDGVYGDISERSRQVLDRIQANGRHLLDLINDVLDLTRIEAGQLALSIDEYDVAQLVSEVVGGLESVAKARGLHLRCCCTPNLPPARGDERRIRQVMLNLVGNALKFTDKGGIAVTASLDGRNLVLSVEDTGPGIAEADQARIFEEFQQVDPSSTREKGGSGLGLAISKRIVELHGGTLTVRSSIGVGSTFIAALPHRLTVAGEVE